MNKCREVRPSQTLLRRPLRQTNSSTSSTTVKQIKARRHRPPAPVGGDAVNLQTTSSDSDFNQPPALEGVESPNCRSSCTESARNSTAPYSRYYHNYRTHSDPNYENRKHMRRQKLPKSPVPNRRRKGGSRSKTAVSQNGVCQQQCCHSCADQCELVKSCVGHCNCILPQLNGNRPLVLLQRTCSDVSLVPPNRTNEFCYQAPQCNRINSVCCPHAAPAPPCHCVLTGDVKCCSAPVRSEQTTNCNRQRQRRRYYSTNSYCNAEFIGGYRDESFEDSHCISSCSRPTGFKGSHNNYYNQLLHERQCRPLNQNERVGCIHLQQNSISPYAGSGANPCCYVPLCNRCDVNKYGETDFQSCSNHKAADEGGSGGQSNQEQPRRQQRKERHRLRRLNRSLGDLPSSSSDCLQPSGHDSSLRSCDGNACVACTCQDYINQAFINSLDYYYNVDRVINSVLPPRCGRPRMPTPPLPISTAPQNRSRPGSIKSTTCTRHFAMASREPMDPIHAGLQLEHSHSDEPFVAKERLSEKSYRRNLLRSKRLPSATSETTDQDDSASEEADFRDLPFASRLMAQVQHRAASPSPPPDPDSSDPFNQDESEIHVQVELLAQEPRTLVSGPPSVRVSQSSRRQVSDGLMDYRSIMTSSPHPFTPASQASAWNTRDSSGSQNYFDIVGEQTSAKNKSVSLATLKENREICLRNGVSDYGNYYGSGHHANSMSASMFASSDADRQLSVTPISVDFSNISLSNVSFSTPSISPSPTFPSLERRRTPQAPPLPQSSVKAPTSSITRSLSTFSRRLARTPTPSLQREESHKGSDTDINKLNPGKTKRFLSSFLHRSPSKPASDPKPLSRNSPRRSAPDAVSLDGRCSTTGQAEQKLAGFHPTAGWNRQGILSFQADPKHTAMIRSVPEKNLLRLGLKPLVPILSSNEEVEKIGLNNAKEETRRALHKNRSATGERSTWNPSKKKEHRASIHSNPSTNSHHKQPRLPPQVRADWKSELSKPVRGSFSMYDDRSGYKEDHAVISAVPDEGCLLPRASLPLNGLQVPASRPVNDHGHAHNTETFDLSQNASMLESASHQESCRNGLRNISFLPGMVQTRRGKPILTETKSGPSANESLPGTQACISGLSGLHHPIQNDKEPINYVQFGEFFPNQMTIPNPSSSFESFRSSCEKLGPLQKSEYVQIDPDKTMAIKSTRENNQDRRSPLSDWSATQSDCTASHQSLQSIGPGSTGSGHGLKSNIRRMFSARSRLAHQGISLARRSSIISTASRGSTSATEPIHEGSLCDLMKE